MREKQSKQKISLKSNKTKIKIPTNPGLSPGQMDLQFVASSGKLNLRRDLGWVAKR